MLKGDEGANINGPSLIKVPSWIKNPLGKYYLYFAHHQGTYIRMAYADDLEGDWHIYKPGVLHQKETVFGEGPSGVNRWDSHIASPEVIIDNRNKRLIMYFHGLGPGIPDCHCTSVAVSKDGLRFTQPDNAPIIRATYLRVFHRNDSVYLIGRLGRIFRTNDYLSGLKEGPNPFDILNTRARLRHPAILDTDSILYVFYSRIGDKPESIVMSKIRLHEDWNLWEASSPVTIAQPEREYEGVNLPLIISEKGTATEEVRELRDPYVFQERDNYYLLYSVKGEKGIAIAKLKFYD